MCGICGVIGGDPVVERPRVAAMTRRLRHRGPDAGGVHAEGGAVLGARRLTIIDPETGDQPMCNEDGDVWITYNGEIYNFRELRAGLIEKGHRFSTESDTEVILHLYEELGPDCVEKLRGMFAFAIWDRKRERLFAARDRMGQKPFHYAARAGRLYFASEVKALLTHPEIEARPELRAVGYYLGLRFVPPPLTMVRGIRKLAAGHRLIWEGGDPRVEPYWRLSFRDARANGRERSDESWIAELRERVAEAVSSHMVSDVPVGGLLSGGIDSSIVVACMANHQASPVPTFAIGSGSDEFDERGPARRVADHVGTEHHEREVGPGVLDRIPELVACLDEPSDPISACMYEAARFASEHVRVVLGGDGGDEIFAGFDRYAAFRWVSRYAALPRWLRQDLIRPVVRGLPVSFGYKGLAERARWLDSVSDHPTPGGRYARMTSFFRFGPSEKGWLYGPRLREALAAHDSQSAVSGPYAQAPADDPLHRMLYADVVTRLPEHTLMLTDRLSMAHGLEMRAPLLDHRLAEFCAGMPAHLKIRRGTTKHAMRRAASNLLPREIVERPKQGFMFPVADWLNEETLPEIRSWLERGPLVEEEWIAPGAPERLVGEHLARNADHHVRIWMLLNLDVWHRLNIGGGVPEAGWLSSPSTPTVPAPTEVGSPGGVARPESSA